MRRGNRIEPVVEGLLALRRGPFDGVGGGGAGQGGPERVCARMRVWGCGVSRRAALEANRSAMGRETCLVDNSFYKRPCATAGAGRQAAQPYWSPGARRPACLAHRIPTLRRSLSGSKRALRAHGGAAVARGVLDECRSDGRRRAAAPAPFARVESGAARRAGDARAGGREGAGNPRSTRPWNPGRRQRRTAQCRSGAARRQRELRRGR